MLKNPIPQVTNQLQYRAIGIINGKYTPHDIEQLNRGFLIDDKGEKIETVVLGKALSILKKHIDLKKSYYWVVYPKNKNTQNLHLQVAGIWDPYQLNDFPNNSSKTNFSKLLKELDKTIFKFIILCGEFFELSIKKFLSRNNEFIHFKNTNKIMQFLEEKVHNNDIILIKCSNSTKINKFAKILLKQVSI